MASNKKKRLEAIADHLALQASQEPQDEFIMDLVSTPEGENTILHQKIFFLHQTGHDGFSRFCTKIIFFSHQLGFFPAPKQFFSAPNDFGNCI